jgi:hypothetical protein
LRAELVAALAANADRLRRALRAELAQSISLGPGRRLQFEIDDFCFGVTLCATEGILLPGDWLDEVLPADWFERADDSLDGSHDIICEELCPWFAECWEAIGGPAAFSPAYLFFHWYPQQYDLERRSWTPAGEAFGE